MDLVGEIAVTAICSVAVGEHNGAMAVLLWNGVVISEDALTGLRWTRSLGEER